MKKVEAIIRTTKFDEVKDRILNGMIHKKAQAVAKQLRDSAKIEYLDAGIQKQVEEEKKRAGVQQQQLIEQLKKMQEAKQGAKPAAQPATEEKN